MSWQMTHRSRSVKQTTALPVDTSWQAIDGRTAASGGTAQYPTLLNSYVVRPPWYVAGVDYAVGPHSGTIFANPTISPPTGTSYNSTNQLLTADGDNVIIDGYDFSVSNGVHLYVPGNNCIIRNCNFAGSNYPSLSGSVVNLAGANPTFEYNTIDGSATGGADAQSGLIVISSSASGTATVRYNWLKNFAQHIVEFNAPMTLVMKYNNIHEGVIETGGHMNWLQNGITGTFTPDVEFNCFYQSLTGGAEGLQFYSGGTATCASPISQYNTMIALGPSSVMSRIVHGTNDFVNTTLSGSPVMQQNYFDISGAFGAFYPNSITSGWSVSGNIDMSNGKTINADNTES